MAHSDDPTVPLTAMRVMRRVRSDPPDPSQIVGSEMNPTAKTVERPQYVDDRRNGVMRLGGAKLSMEDVGRIRILKGQSSSREVGSNFGVSHTSVLEIWRGQRWVTVPR